MSTQETYRHFCAEHQVPLFHQPWWLDLVHPNWMALIAKEKENIIGIWPLCIDNKLGFSLSRNPALTPYLGPVFFIPEQQKTYSLWTIEDKCYAQFQQQLPSCSFEEYRCRPGYANFLPLKHKGFQVSQGLTYHIDLKQPLAKIWANMKSSQRNHIRQAEKELMVIEGNHQLEQFCALHQQTFIRKNKPYPTDKQQLIRLMQAGIDRHSGRMLTALYPDQTVAAMAYVVWDQQQMYLLLSSINQDKVHSGAVSLLIWQAIQLAQSMNLSIFDFEGSMDVGIEQFFRSFGGQRVPYLVFSRTQSKLWAIKKMILG